MTPIAPGTPPAWHTLPPEVVLSRLETGPNGLTADEARSRLAVHGRNEIEGARRVSPWSLLVEQFKNVLIAILLIATALSAFLGHGVEAIAIAVIVAFAVVLGFLQEFRAERAIEALRQLAAPAATALRDGEEVEVPAQELVPGDVVLLRAGDRIPADGRLLEVVNLQTEEAALTGESLPIEKQSAPIAGTESPLGDRRCMVYSGTAAVYGRGRAVVVATGMVTEFGRIAQMLHDVETVRTPLQVNLDRLGKTLARAALAIVLAIVALGLVRGQPFIEMFVFGVALAVAVVPEALPAVVTISLALGVQRMARRHALVRRLPAVETLGSTSVICSDKTGTLTRDEMTVRRIHAAGRTLEVSGAGYEPRGSFLEEGTPVPLPAPARDLLRAGVLASDAHIVFREAEGRWVVKGDPTEGALVAAAAKGGLHKDELDTGHPRVDEIPFTSESKRMTTLHATPQGLVACSKGAPEIVLASCTRYRSGEDDVVLDAASRAAILEVAQAMARDALRVLGVAVKPGATRLDAECDLTFLGLVGMIDPPRPEALGAVQQCRRAGVQVMMMTGDHPLTAQAVAGELGLLDTGRVVAGAELEAMPDDRLEREVESLAVCARVSPAHKLRIVTALQRRGHVVAMTGDGINDAPALKKADIGVAMGITGTDVTKEAAAMTLTDDNFASIVAAVEEGRGIFSNIKKYVMYLLSSNIGEMTLMAAASLAGLPLPLSAVQILYVNLATDGLPALALAVDPPAADLMARPPRDPRAGVFTRRVVNLMILAGLWSGLVTLGLFVWALRSGRPAAEASTLTFVELVLIQFFNAYNFRSDRHSAFRGPLANRWLNLAIAWELLLLSVVVHWGPLHAAFGTFALPAQDWILAASLAFTIVPVVEAGKWLGRRAASAEAG